MRSLPAHPPRSSGRPRGGASVGTVRARSRARDGFTLIELMIVVVLIGISAAMLAPSVSRAMAINRTNRCQYDAARMFRAARANAIGTGRAHLVDATFASGASTLFVYIGDSSSCARSQWPGIVGVDAPVDGLAEITYTVPAHGVNLGFLPPVGGGGAPLQVCFEPSGERYERTARVGPFTRGRSTLVFTIDRTENGGNAGDPQRQIILPQFGTARVLR